MAQRMKWPQPLNRNIKDAIWSFVVRQDCLKFFRLASPRPSIKTFDRDDYITGENEVSKFKSRIRKYNLSIENISNQTECPFTSYESNFIEMDGLRGSCQDFGSRELVLREALLGRTLNEVVEE